MPDHTPRARFDAHRADIERQAEVIVSARASELGRRAVLVEVYDHRNGQRLADVVRTTFGPVAVTYRPAEGRVTGDVAAVVPLTDEADQQLALAEPFSPLPAARLRAALARGVQTVTLSLDADQWAQRQLDGHRRGASALSRQGALRRRLRIMLRHKADLGYSEPSIRETAARLREADARLDRLRAEAEAARDAARRRRNPAP